MDKVSVIIPTCNREIFLRGAISSVLKQTYRNLEVLVADDRSTDRTREMVKNFDDGRIKYILCKGKKGPSATRNQAILKSRGEYIAFLDDDDEWLPDKLSRQINVLDQSQPNICGVYSNRIIFERRTGKIISKDPGTNNLNGNLLHQLAIKSPIHTSTLVIKKKCLDKVGLFDESISYMEDRDLWIRLSMHWDFEYISTPLTRVYIHGSKHLSKNLEFQTEGKEKMLERYDYLFKRKRDSWSRLYVSLGAQYCQLKQMKKGRKNIIKGIKIYPFMKIGYYHLFASLLGPNAYQRLRGFYKSNPRYQQ